jgi:hypothetical protein
MCIKDSNQPWDRTRPPPQQIRQGDTVALARYAM